MKKSEYLLATIILFSFLVNLTACSPLEQSTPRDDTIVVSGTEMQATSPMPTYSFEQPNNYLENSMESQNNTMNEISDSPKITPEDCELVRIVEFIPEIYIDLSYASTQNFTGEKIYYFEDAWLRYGTVKKLQIAQRALSERGYSLKIWDAYRPHSAQFKLWELVPDATYVANPYTGFSAHSSGDTLDLTLVRNDGSALEMPSRFDDFSALADRDYSEVSEAAKENARILEQTMAEAGFEGYYYEWWHYSDCDSYPYEDIADLQLPLNIHIKYEPVSEACILLREAPSYEAGDIARIPSGASFSVFGWTEEFARIEYDGKQGYVVIEDIKMIIK